MTQEDIPRKLGRYEIVRELGKGAMGVVYEGKDPNIGRRVAIKTARRDVIEASGMADEMMERFLREARAAGALSHPNIITVYDAGEEEGIAYIAMELLEGGDLHDYILANRRFEVAKVVEICATVAAALGHAHSKGVIHRDVKPANIVMPTNGPLKVADFGIAHVSDSTLTQTGAMIGTPHYMSPEQFMGQHVDGRSDLFSLGIILYEMLTGERPFTGDSLSAVMHKVLRLEPVQPRDLNFAVNECLNKVAMKALSKDPGKRYQTGEAMAAALHESLKDHPDPTVLGVSVPEAAEATVLVTSQPEATILGEAATVLSTAEASGTSARKAATVAGEAAVAPAAALPEAAVSRRSRKKLVVVAVVVLLAAAIGIGAVVAFLPEGAYFDRVNISVLDADDKPLYGASATIQDPESGAEAAVDVPKGQDLFRFSELDEFKNLKPKRVEVTAKKVGYKSNSMDSVEATKPGDRAEIELNLTLE